MPPPKITTTTLQKAKKLVQPGYAGLLSLREARDILAQISHSARVRKAWGFPERQQSYSLGLIAERAYPEDHKAARAHIQSQMAEEKGKADPATVRREAPKPSARKKPLKLAPKPSSATSPKTMTKDKARSSATPKAKPTRTVASPRTPPSVTPRRAARAATPKPSAPRPTQLPLTPATRRRPAPRRVPA